MFSTVGKSPEQLEQERMAMMQGRRPSVAQHAQMTPQGPSAMDKLKTTATNKLINDGVGTGIDYGYEKAEEGFNKLKLKLDPTANVDPSAPVGGPLATPVTPPTAPLPGSLQLSVADNAAMDADSMMSQTGPVAAPVGGPLASATQIPGSLGANTLAQGTGMQALTGGGAELAAGKMAEQAALGSITGGTGAVTGAAVAPTAAAGTGAMASMGAAVPYVGAALAADELLGLGIREKIFGFAEGGEVPSKFKGFAKLPEAVQQKIDPDAAGKYAHGGEVEYAGMGGMMGLGPLALKKMQEEGVTSGGLLGLAMMSAGGPVSKVKYIAAGGEVKEHVEVQYNKGPLAY